MPLKMPMQDVIEELLVNLPHEGPYSQRAFGLYCVERVVHLHPDPKVTECLEVVRRKVNDPSSVSDEELTRVWSAVYTQPNGGCCDWPEYFVPLAASLISLEDPSLLSRKDYKELFDINPDFETEFDMPHIGEVATATAFAVATAPDDDDVTFVTDYNAEQRVQFEYLRSFIKHMIPPSELSQFLLSIVPIPIYTRGQVLWVHEGRLLIHLGGGYYHEYTEWY